MLKLLDCLEFPIVPYKIVEIKCLFTRVAAPYRKHPNSLWLIRTKHFPESKTRPRIPEHLQESKTHPKKPKTHPRIQNTSQIPKHFWILGSILDSGKCFGFWGVLLVSGTYSGFWDVFWILGRVFEFSEVLLDCGTCFGFWRCFWILGHVLSLRATAWTWWSLTKKWTVKSDCICCGSIIGLNSFLLGYGYVR